MKNILIVLFTIISAVVYATPVSPTVTPSVTGTQTLKVGQAPEVNHFAASSTSYYRISWRTITVGATTVNYLVSFAYGAKQFFTADNVYAATTYAEIQSKCTALGITNLPVDPNAGH